MENPVIAMFIPDEHGKYIPANKTATGEGAKLSKMHLDRFDLLTIKSKGIVVCQPNGQEIVIGEFA